MAASTSLLVGLPRSRQLSLAPGRVCGHTTPCAKDRSLTAAGTVKRDHRNCGQHRPLNREADNRRRAQDSFRGRRHSLNMSIRGRSRLNVTAARVRNRPLRSLRGQPRLASRRGRLPCGEPGKAGIRPSRTPTRSQCHRSTSHAASPQASGRPRPGLSSVQPAA